MVVVYSKNKKKYVLYKYLPGGTVESYRTAHHQSENLCLGVGRAIAEAVSRWLPTAAARVRSWVWSSGICGGQSGAGAGILRVLRFPLPIFIPPNNSPSSQSPGAGQ
jgi:hypothetical protein